MKCESCGKSIDNAEQISSEAGIVCQKCMDKSLGINRCRVCGREYAKWRFCLECGSINQEYHSEDEIKSEDMPNANRKW